MSENILSRKHYGMYLFKRIISEFSFLYNVHVLCFVIFLYVCITYKINIIFWQCVATVVV